MFLFPARGAASSVWSAAQARAQRAGLTETRAVAVTLGAKTTTRYSCRDFAPGCFNAAKVPRSCAARPAGNTTIMNAHAERHATRMSTQSKRVLRRARRARRPCRCRCSLRFRRRRRQRLSQSIRPVLHPTRARTKHTIIQATLTAGTGSTALRPRTATPWPQQRPIR